MQSAILLVLLIPVLVLIHRTLTQRRPLPPGPSPLPLIGNAHQLASTGGRAGLLWKLFDKWHGAFGPIIRVFSPTGTMIILGDYATAHELLDRRAANFSSRPRMPMINDLMYHGNLHFLFRPYGDEFRRHRRMIDPFLTPAASRGYRGVYDYESLRLLRYLLDHCCCNSRNSSSSSSSNISPPSPSDPPHATYHAFRFAVSRYVTSVVFTVMYGFRLETGDEPSIKRARVDNANLTEAMSRVWPCDVFPLLNQLLPEPLAPWKRLARSWHAHQRDHHLGDLATAKRNAAAGGADGGKPGRWNLATAMLQGREATAQQVGDRSSDNSSSGIMSEVEVAFDAGVVSDAGVDTTGAALTVFLLAATAHLDKTRKAQRDIDEVVGRSRLPRLEDRSRLPYITAFLNETMRWRPGIPGGIPHSNLEEDEYKGYRIPKGSVVMVNTGSICRDTKTFGDDVDEFRPERYMMGSEERGGEKQIPPVMGFGFGRRMCIGQSVARDEMFVAAARLLWAFEFVDCQAEGDVSLNTLPNTDTLQDWPVPFGVELRPRDDEVAGVLEAAEMCTPQDVDIRPRE